MVRAGGPPTLSQSLQGNAWLVRLNRTMTMVGEEQTGRACFGAFALHPAPSSSIVMVRAGGPATLSRSLQGNAWLVRLNRTMTMAGVVKWPLPLLVDHLAGKGTSPDPCRSAPGSQQTRMRRAHRSDVEKQAIKRPLHNIRNGRDCADLGSQSLPGNSRHQVCRKHIVRTVDDERRMQGTHCRGKFRPSHQWDDHAGGKVGQAIGLDVHNQSGTSAGVAVHREPAHQIS